jgi:hypothetical protein
MAPSLRDWVVPLLIGLFVGGAGASIFMFAGVLARLDRLEGQVRLIAPSQERVSHFEPQVQKAAPDQQVQKPASDPVAAALCADFEKEAANAPSETHKQVFEDMMKRLGCNTRAKRP